MTYVPTTWVNGGVPDLSAENLNHMEEGIAAALDEAAGDARYVRTVNGTGPDEDGDVEVTGGGGSGSDPDAMTVFGGGKENVAALDNTTGTCTGDVSAANIFTVTPTGNITLAFSNVPASPDGCAIRVIITQGATVRTVTMPSGVHWIGSPAPTQVASKICVIDLQTVDGGTNWIVGAGVEQ